MLILLSAYSYCIFIKLFIETLIYNIFSLHKVLWGILGDNKTSGSCVWHRDWINYKYYRYFTIVVIVIEKIIKYICCGFFFIYIATEYEVAKATRSPLGIVGQFKEGTEKGLR